MRKHANYNLLHGESLCLTCIALRARPLAQTMSLLALFVACQAPSGEAAREPVPFHGYAGSTATDTMAARLYPTGSSVRLAARVGNRDDPNQSAAARQPMKNGAETGTRSPMEGPLPIAPAFDSTAGEALDESAWLEFKQSATHTGASGRPYYIVEGDIPILEEAELRDYYERMIAGDTEKGVVHLYPGTGVRDVWNRDLNNQLDLRYCVDTTANGFDAAGSIVSSAIIVAAMEAAAQAWHEVANINFTYDPANNGNCGVSSAAPDALYIKVSRFNNAGDACAFYPISRATCSGLDGSTIGVQTTYTLPDPWSVLLMHELGHVLGLVHEFFHSNGGGCTASDTQDLTSTVDLTSIMGYNFGYAGCANTTPNHSALSENDGWSARELYGIPAAWYIPILKI